MPRHHKTDLSCDFDTTSDSSIDAIREVNHNTQNIMRKCHKESSSSSSSTIDAIREICNDCEVNHHKRNIMRKCHKESSSSSSSTIDAIREICNDCEVNHHKRNIMRKCRKESSPSSSNTVDAIHEICDDYEMKPRISYREHYYPPKSKYDPGLSYFNSVITPVTGLTPLFSGCTGSVEFRMRRKNKTVTLQWEPFTGSLSASGVAFIIVAQSISNTPPYPISIPIYIQYKGVGRITNVTINPNAISGNILFYLNTDGSTNNINAGDSFTIPGGAISWIVD